MIDGRALLEADALVRLRHLEESELVGQDRSVVGHVPSHVRDDHQRVGQHVDELKVVNVKVIIFHL